VKLAPRFTLAFILFGAALLVGVGLLAYNSGREALRAATIFELQSTALEKEAALNIWVEEKQADISALAADPATIQAASALLEAESDSLDFVIAREMLIASFQSRLDTGEFLEVSLLHPKTGQVIASTNPDEEGKFKENRPYFLNGRTGPYIQNLYYSIALQSIAMTASSPLLAPDGDLAGLLAARLDLEEMNEIISRRTGLHQTDDAYLVNTSNLFVTQPRFLSDRAVLQRGVRTEDVKRCLQQESGVIETTDYRNEPSIMVYRWLPERELCLVINLDEAEAYRPIRTFGGTIAISSAVALLVAALLAFALSQSLTRPILALQKGAARFGRGELDTRLDETSRDELGQLAGEFNKMAEALAEQQTLMRRRAEQFFNLSPDLLCTIDTTGRLLDLNPAWELTLGYDREELKGRLLTDFVHPDDLAITKSSLQRAANQGSGRFENRCWHMEGQYRWLAWVVVISPQDQLLYAAARDITERRKVEERLKQQTEELERSKRELEEFANVATHDLQEPLRLVSNHVQLLARRYQGRLDQNADEFIGFAMEGTNRLKSLISDLLAYSRLGTSDRELVPVELDGILTQLMKNLQTVIKDSRAVITHDPLPEVLGDSEQITELLQNLIINSIKFRGKEPPRVHVGARQLSERWLIFVRDNGIGIDPQYTERVFVIFQRLHSRDDYPGTGIGLAICRKIVERHGGRIWVDSEPGKGSTFYFTLQPAESWPPEIIQPEVATKRPRDAIVDRATDLI
jgi:PAS domain S-box-containing protein